MKQLYQELLFTKGILVADAERDAEHGLETAFSLAALFNIRLVSGIELAEPELISFVSEQLGVDVPEPFYRGFPESVRELSTEELLFDQLFHYVQTYGLKQFGQAGHSIFENLLERSAFREDAPIRDYAILTEKEAEKQIIDFVQNLLRSSRPLSDYNYEIVREAISDYRIDTRYCASKNTAIRLLADTCDLKYTSFLSMSDVIKLLDEINYRIYANENLKKLNLTNQDRKLITAVMNRLFEAGRVDLRTCCEKKKIWCGLLHHIHYRPCNALAEQFVTCMRGKENLSVYAEFEREMARQNYAQAALVLREGKSPTAVLRNLNYLLSRCTAESEVDSILDLVEGSKLIVLLQLYQFYSFTDLPWMDREFVFSVHNQLRIHHETEEEYHHSRSCVTTPLAERAGKRIEEYIRKALYHRLGRVYIDPAMRLLALPLQENTAQLGLGVLPRGSRIPIEKGKKIRAFTYWEKVNDIDLSVIGIDEDDEEEEYSWRTMAANQSAAITFSGDETSGFSGGSEYFDIDLEAFRQLHPGVNYLIFCNNVYSGRHFSSCSCKAGYMLRDVDDSGEIFEPKTVQSSFVINCNSTFAYLFAIDLKKNEFVWLNAARYGREIVAGITSSLFLTRYLELTSVMNWYRFFELMATELVENPTEADVVISDQRFEIGEYAEQIRSCDYDRILALLNQ